MDPVALGIDRNRSAIDPDRSVFLVFVFRGSNSVIAGIDVDLSGVHRHSVFSFDPVVGALDFVGAGINFDRIFGIDRVVALRMDRKRTFSLESDRAVRINGRVGVFLIYCSDRSFADRVRSFQDDRCLVGIADVNGFQIGIAQCKNDLAARIDDKRIRIRSG